MNFTGPTDEPHRPGTPGGVRPATGTPAALASLARATDGASRDDAARPGFSPTGRACCCQSARRGDGWTPSATFVHIAFLAYLAFGWSLRVRWFHRGNTAAALVPAPSVPHRRPPPLSSATSTPGRCGRRNRSETPGRS